MHQIIDIVRYFNNKLNTRVTLGVVDEEPDFDFGNMVIYPTKKLLLFSEQVINYYNEKELFGIVAHEFGHLFHSRRLESHPAELFADKFAVKQLNIDPITVISNQLKFACLYCGQNHSLLRSYINTSSTTHPSIKLRAKALGVDLKPLLKERGIIL